MKTKTETRKSLSQLSHLPSFAQYLLQHRLEEYVRAQYEISLTMDIPMLRFFKDMPEEKLLELSQKGTVELLTALSAGKAQEYIDRSIQLWKQNQLPVIKKDEIAAEDITLITYLRKRSMLLFLQDYSSDFELAIELVNEIDLFLTISETALTNTYINLLQQKINEDNLLIEKVNHTIPGAVYVFDLIEFKGIYSNNKLGSIIGYEHGKLNELGLSAINELVHPDDRIGIQSHIDAVKKAKDGEVKVFKYRIRNKDGFYHWVSNNEAVFKRDEAGNAIQTIGITLDIDKEENIAEELRKKDIIHNQAEAITHIGNYTWNIQTNELKWSDELCRIYGLDPRKDVITYDLIEKYTEEADRPTVMNSIQAATLTNGSFDFYYRINSKDGKQKIVHCRGFQVPDNKEIILGTVQDVTEKQGLIGELQKNQAMYRQAERLANMGNWTWDLSTNKITWTDQLYHIYGLEPQSEEITIERFLSLVHPGDRIQVESGIDDILKKDLVDSTFRILTGNNSVKVLRSVAQLHRDEKGQPVMVYGTERDITEKQNLIGRLQESEKLYKTAQSLARMGNWTLDLTTMNYTWSDEMYNIFELDRNIDISFEEWLGIISADERDSVKEYFEECLRERKLYDRIHKIVLPNGKSKIIHRKADLILDKEGVPVQMVGTTQDITEDYRVQQELKENQRFIQKITDATPSIISSYNVNTGKYVFISEGLEKLLGYQRGQAMEKGVDFFIELVHPDDLSSLSEKNAKALEEANSDPTLNNLVIEFIYRLRHSNGHYRWFHTYGTIFDRNDEGRVEHVLNISLDVSEQVEATQKIKDQEHFIQQIADASPTILYLYNVNTQSIEYINREIFFVLGYLPEEILEAGSEITKKLYNPEDYHLLPGRKESEKNFQQIDSMIQYECRLRNKDGEWRWLLVREIVFKTDESGQITQVLGAALDINRRKDMERTILQNTMLLEQSNASLEEFAYVASHDLKEPLRKISTFGDRLMATQVDNLAPEGKIYLQKIVDASQRMQTMINDLLSISMISGNTAYENFSLQKIFDETIQTLEFKIEQQNAIIKADPLPEARIIPSQFRQLFQNLLSNSLKFVRPGVQPVIMVQYTSMNASEMIHYQLSHAERYHKLEFSDNGIGFENEFAGKIFAIFQRLHGRSEYEGSGIGLAICKKIVEHHGGIIYARGVPDEGSIFTIILPA